MKKRSSIVWRYFDRLEENKRCVGVLCKLCDTQYKFFGNTTNMRAHLTCKHPLQWELGQSGNLDESTLRYEEESEQPTVSVGHRKKYKDKNVDILSTNYESDIEHQEDNDAGIQLVRQMRNSQTVDEEWLEEEAYQTIEPQTKRRRMPYKKIKREIESPPRRMSHKTNAYIPNSMLYEQPERLIIQEPQRKDEYSVFGEYVANKLRKVKLPKTRGNLQQLITTILWQAEYGMYDTADAVKRVLSFSVNDDDDKVQQNTVTLVTQEQEPNQSTEIEEEFVVANSN
ncbi:uncharacterized protein isoform X2 [Choristoneura fumiferana]|uniref:uncharacterized protein isoform X2 n=1 Tax=Choristoneura fumiferana TaxID=7141 RepID=UPI003D154A1C